MGNALAPPRQPRPRSPEWHPGRRAAHPSQKWRAGPERARRMQAETGRSVADAPFQRNTVLGASARGGGISTGLFQPFAGQVRSHCLPRCHCTPRRRWRAALPRLRLPLSSAAVPPAGCGVRGFGLWWWYQCRSVPVVRRPGPGPTVCRGATAPPGAGGEPPCPG